MTRSLMLMLVALVLVVVGCTGDSESVPSTSTSSSTSSTTSTIEPTSTTTSTVTTTETTLDKAAEVEAAVEAAYFRTYDVFVECYRTLPDCDPAAAFEEVFVMPTYIRQVEAALGAKEDGLVYGPPVDPSHARTQIIDVQVDDAMTRAVVSFCTVAGDQEYVVGSDGSRTLTDNNEDIAVEWGDGLFLLGDDGIWRASDYPDNVGGDAEFPFAELDQRIEEGTLCDGFLEG